MRARLVLAASLLLLATACDGVPAADGGTPPQAPDDAGGVATGDGGVATGDGGPPPPEDAGGGRDAGEAPLEDDGGPGPDAGSLDAGGEPSEVGTFDNPILVDSFPFTFEGDTTLAPSRAADAYSPCAPTTREEGGEFVFRLEIPNDAADDRQLTVSVNDVAGDMVDIDVHLLSAASPDACIARNNTVVTEVVSPGDVLFVVADSWTNASGVSLEGPFVVTMSLTDLDVGQCLVNPIPSCGDTSFPDVNGVPTEPAGLDGCPAGMLAVDTFCVDRYEAMLVEVLPDQSLAPWSPYQNPGNTTVRALSVPGAVPQGYISGTQAAAACANAGKRLCSNTEWLRACRGPSSTTYPYGNTRQPGVCNDDRTCHPAVQYFETSADWIWSELGHPCINQLPASLDDTGENASCVTAEGLYDMMGNLHEWTSDPAGTFRGGFYADTVINGNGCLYATTAHNVSHWDYSTGFRCCADMP